MIESSSHVLRVEVEPLRHGRLHAGDVDCGGHDLDVRHDRERGRRDDLGVVQQVALGPRIAPPAQARKTELQLCGRQGKAEADTKKKKKKSAVHDNFNMIS